jgi:glycosyltransferase involved in cell wall biosynthesis
MLRHKNILLISPEPWEHIFVSKHHYAVHLAKRGNKVFFLNPPFRKFSISETCYEDVFLVFYKGFPPGLRFYPGFIQRFLIKKVFKKLERLCCITFDFIWSFDNSVFFDFSALPERVFKISHIVDLNQNFQTGIAAKTADVCFGVSAPIVKRLQAYNQNTYFVNHGCSNAHEVGSPVFLPGFNKIKAFYTGNLNISYFDWPLFKQIIDKNKEVDFILAGPWAESIEKDRILAYSNVYYLGKIGANALPGYYSAADLLLIIYKSDQFPEQLSNPHKMMEYLSMGKVVVATYTSEYTKLANDKLIIMTSSREEYITLFNKTVQDITQWNSIEKQQARKSFAMHNSYHKQLLRIEEILGNLK